MLLTTHSPHIASVAPLASVLLLQKNPSGDGSIGRSAKEAELSPEEIIDLERYLDATRAEVLFARGVILVEGPSEQFLLPAFAGNMGFPFDEYGVTVCSVHGTDFMPYVKLLGTKGLNIPFVVITDGDWFVSDQKLLSRGFRRATKIAQAIDTESFDRLLELCKDNDWSTLYKESASLGIFVGNRTLELDLFDAGFGKQMKEALDELDAPVPMRERIKAFIKNGPPLNESDSATFLDDVARFGKGRFAQRLASKINTDNCPPYIKNAITRIVTVLSS